MSEPTAPTRTSWLLPAAIVAGVLLVSGGVFVGLVMPQITRARTAATRMQEHGHFKMIGGMMHGYHDAVDGTLPRTDAFRAPDGKPLLSWRVKLLPYLDEQKLYERFRLDEPWDSPHNFALLPLMPRTYGRPGDDTKRGLTHYQAVVGKGLLFDPLYTRDGMLAGRRLSEVPDLTSNTVMLVVAKDPVPWTKPEDIDADDGSPLVPRLDTRFPGTTVLMADGSVRSVRPNLSEATWRAVLTAAGGEPVPAEWDGK